MIRDLLKWVAPGMALTVFGTMTAVAMTTPNMRVDLGSQGRAGLAAADVSVEDSGVSRSEQIVQRPFPTGLSHASGTLPRIEVAQTSGSGSIVQLAPPRVSDYWVSVTRQTGGILVFDGYAPDQATRDGFAELADTDVNFLKLGGGAPATYQAGVDFGLKLLAHMSEGRFALNSEGLSISGTAETLADDRAIRALLDDQLPEGINLANTDITGPQGPVEPEPEAQDTPIEPPAEAVDTTPPPVEDPVAAPAVEPETPAPTAVGAPMIDPAYHFSATRSAEGVTLTGQVPAAATASYLASLSGAEPTDLVVTPGAPDDFASNAQAGMRALLQLNEGRLAFEDGGWSLSGTAASGTEKQTIETGLSALPNWSTAIDTGAPIALCQDRLAELSAHNAILFQSGNAVIADSANAELDLFAEALALCPQAQIYVEGHTDSDGDDQLNLVLSVARAEAVVDALIERGVDMSRLYAIGYGETQPVADNATAEGKRQNRRIVVTMAPPEE